MVEEKVTNEVRKISEVGVKEAGKITSEALKIFVAFLNSEYTKHNDNQTLKSAGEIPYKRFLRLANKGHEIYNQFIDSADVEDFKKHLNKFGVGYSILDMKKDSSKMICYFDVSCEKMKNAVDSFMLSRNLINEVTPSLLFSLSDADNGRLGVVDTLSPEEIELIRYFAPENNFKFAIANNKVFYLAADEKAAVNVLKAIQSVRTNSNKDIIYKNIKKYTEGKDNLKKVKSKELQETYVVSDDFNKLNSFIKITPEGYDLYKNNIKISEQKRSSPDFVNRLSERLKNYNNPVVLSESEFNNELFRKNIAASRNYEFPDLSNIEIDKEIDVKEHFNKYNIKSKGRTMQNYLYSKDIKLEKHKDNKIKEDKNQNLEK